MVTVVTKENFDSFVKQNAKPVLLDFWAPWCGPCRMVGPIVEEIAQEREDIAVGKINVDEEVELAMWRFASMKPIQNFEGWLLQRDKMIVNMMCETFGVSKAALLIRLRHLGYLVDLPYSEYKEPWEVWA